MSRLPAPLVVRAADVVPGDILVKNTYTGVVLSLPEWEAVAVFGVTKRQGTIVCEDFGAYVWDDDLVLVHR